MAATKEKRAKVEENNRLKELDSEDREDTSSIMKLEVKTFKVRGLSPLLQNNPTEFIGMGDDATVRTGKKKYDDNEEASLRTYKDADGDFCHPAEAFLKAITKAARGKKIGKLHAAQMIQAGVFAAEPYNKILDAKGNPYLKYSIDRRSVVVGRARVLRCRPCWANWTMVIALEIDVNLFPGTVGLNVVKELLALAGRYPGIGDYRPEKGGAFGRFEIV